LSRNIWIDTDIALGSKSGDVDDAYAIVAVIRAIQHRAIQPFRGMPGTTVLAGISVTSGNTDEVTACRCLGWLLEALGAASVPITRAAAAARSIAELPHGTTFLALGPLTNLANACALNPKLGERIRLIHVGGVLKPWHWRYRLSDLNMRRDQSSATSAIRCVAHRQQFPLDVIARLRLDRDRLHQLERAGRLGGYLALHSRRWLRGAAIRRLSRSFPLWDLVAALSAIGALPSERFDALGRLQGFDECGAWEAFLGLVDDGRLQPISRRPT
jgi:inosine-uridine nucleoside N-ribohydrolase